MNRTIKDATVRRFFYTTHASLRAHLATLSRTPPSTAAHGETAHLGDQPGRRKEVYADARISRCA